MKATKPASRFVFSNYDAPRNPFYGGGGASAIHEVARRLAVRHRVSVVAGKFPGSRDEQVDGVSYRYLGSASLGPKAGQLLFQALLPLRVRRGDFDLWVESLTPPFSTACLPLFTRRPVIALTQVLAGQAMSRKYGLPFGMAERLGLRAYRHAIALSGYLKEYIAQANPRIHATVIPNGVARELIHRPAPEQRAERHLLFLGRIDVEQKGLDLLLKAFTGVADQIGRPLIIAGSGAARDEARVAQLIREQGLTTRVRCAGRVEGTAKETLLDQAMMVVMPSRFEASPLVMIEAFCYGLPVVLFGIPELKEMPGTCCVQVPPFDVQALGRAMLELSRDGARRHSTGAAAKQLARRYDWDDLARQYEDFFESVLETR